MQQQKVVSWLAQHNFPHGMVSFCDGLSYDPLRHKTNYLRTLMIEVSQFIFQECVTGKGMRHDLAMGLSKFLLTFLK